MMLFLVLMAYILSPSSIIEITENANKSITKPEIHSVVDSYKGVKVYHNGGMRKTHGRNLTKSGYNLGLKWQCVEFVKRFYYEYFNHKMPDSYGHAKDFYNINIGDGYNAARDLNQFKNGGSKIPQKDMIIVFDGNKQNPFGHIAIISKVKDKEIEVVQQNWGVHTRMTLPLKKSNGSFTVLGHEVLGWLGR